MRIGGEAPEDKDGYLFTRYLAHVDFHAGKNFRTFVQLQSSMANGKKTQPSRLMKISWIFTRLFLIGCCLPERKKRSCCVLAGRNYLMDRKGWWLYGDGPNNRQSFDAAKLAYTGGSLKMDILFSHYVLAKQEIFDDGFNKNTRLWGAYIIKNKVPFLQNVDVYYFGLWKRNAKFDDGAGTELRHSIGSRIWNSKNNFRYDIEGVYQFGNLAGKEITAWTFSLNTGYKFSSAILKPEIGLKTELISGDALHGDTKLQTFNPLFPRGSYFGLAALIGPSNLFDIHPSIALDIIKKIVLSIDTDLFWRYSINDGIYGPNVALIYAAENNRQAYLGTQLSTDLVYTPNGSCISAENSHGSKPAVF